MAWRVASFWLVATAGAPVAVAAALFSRAGFQITGCVEAPGMAGWFGTRFALVHAEPACGPGTLALGGTHAQVLTVLACVALPALLAHIGLLVAGAHIAGRCVRAARCAIVGFTVFRPRVPRFTVPRAPRRLTLPPSPELPPPASRPVLVVPGLRAPPVCAAA
jgi:hypothetical protein